MRPLGDILTDIVNGVTISDEDKDGLRLLGNQLQNVSSSVSGWTQGDPGQISNVSFLAGGSNVLIDALGIRIYDPPLLTGWWEIDGDLRIGSNLSSADTTSFSIFSNAQTYNSEALGTGDVLFGSNSSGYANMLWDYSDKQLKFRGGTTTQAYVGTDGVIYFGAGAGFLGATGATITSGVAYDTARSFKFANSSGTVFVDYYGFYSAVDSVAGSRIFTDGDTTNFTNFAMSSYLDVYSSGTGTAACGIHAYNVDIFGDASVLCYVQEANISYVSAWAKSSSGWVDLQVGAGLEAANKHFYLLANGKISFDKVNGIDEFSTDGLMAGNSDTAVPTEKAVKTYADTKLSDAPSDGTTYGRNNAAWVAAGGSGGDGWQSAAGTWTPRSQAYTNDPAAGANIELSMADTTGFEVGDVVNVSSSAGDEDTIITVVHANTHITVSKLYYNHTTTTPVVKHSTRIPVSMAYTNDPAAGANIELNMADTTGFAVGQMVEVSSDKGDYTVNYKEYATVTVVHVNTHITVDNLTANHTTSHPMVKVMTNQTFIVDTSSDLSGSIGVGNRIKLTQDATTKYFIITAIATTRITLFGGTDYTLTTTAITNPYYSNVKAPYAFPLNPVKWTVSYKDLCSVMQAAPVASTWYNVGANNISLPVGCWNTDYAVAIDNTLSTGTNPLVWATLSTASNSESDKDLSCAVGMVVVGSGAWQSFVDSGRNKFVSVTSRTPYYFNMMTTVASAFIGYYGSLIHPLLIRAVCAYL